MLSIHCSSELHRGHNYKQTVKMMKIFVIAAVLVAVSADPYYGYGQYAWPSAYGYGFSSTCYGCRGKRSAEPEPEPYYGFYGYPYAYGPGIAAHPGAATSYTQRSPQGIGKRSAEPEPYYGYYGGYGYHPTGTSYVGRTIWGLRGKRSAEADPEPYYGYGGYYGRGYGGYYGGYRGYGYGYGYYG